MKRLLLIAAFVAAPAMADSYAMPNKAGGEIVVTDRECPANKALRDAYLYGGGGKYMHGCWTYLDNMVHVVWDDGTRYAYPPENFYKKSETKNKGTKL